MRQCWASLDRPSGSARSRCFVSACSILPLSVHFGTFGPGRKGIVQRTAQPVAPAPPNRSRERLI